MSCTNQTCNFELLFRTIQTSMSFADGLNLQLMFPLSTTHSESPGTTSSFHWSKITISESFLFKWKASDRVLEFEVMWSATRAGWVDFVVFKNGRFFKHFRGWHVNISPCLWMQLIAVGIWIRGKFKLKIDRSVKTPWQEYGVHVVADSWWWAPVLDNSYRPA